MSSWQVQKSRADIVHRVMMQVIVMSKSSTQSFPFISLAWVRRALFFINLSIDFVYTTIFESLLSISYLKNTSTCLAPWPLLRLANLTSDSRDPSLALPLTLLILLASPTAPPPSSRLPTTARPLRRSQARCLRMLFLRS